MQLRMQLCMQLSARSPAVRRPGLPLLKLTFSGVMMKGEPVRPKKTTGYTVFLREWYKDNQQPGGFTEGVREGAAAWAKTPEKQREYQVRAAEEAQQAKALWDAWFASLPDERKVKIDKWMAAAGTKNSTPPSKPKKSSWPSKPDLPLSRDAHGRPTRPKQNAHKYFHGEFWTEAKMKLGAKLSSQDTSRINGQASDAWQAMSDDQKKVCLRLCMWCME